MLKILMIFLLLSSCSHHHLDSQSIEIRFLKSFHLKTDYQFNHQLVGGLSALYYEKEEKIYWALSDDRGKFGPPRIYKISFNVIEDDAFEIKDVLYLKDENAEFFSPNVLDPEGLVLLDNGHFLITSEGHISSENFTSQPRLMEFDKKGQFIKNWVVPKDYEMSLNHGVKDNQGLESLAKSSSYIFTSNEMPLAQDDIGGLDNRKVRVYRYEKKGSSYTPCFYNFYPLDIMPKSKPEYQADLGLVEILPIDDNNLLFMERGYVWEENINQIRLYLTRFESRFRRDLAPSKHSVGHDFKKQLLIDLDSVISSLPKDQQFLDNMEGMTWGPNLPNGHRTLVVVSDNNFNSKQRTLFLVFEVVL